MYRRVFIFLVMCPLLALFSLSCADDNVSNILRHFKRPLSMAKANVALKFCHSGTTVTTQFCFDDSQCREGESCKAGPKRHTMFVANTDINMISVIDMFNRRLLFDPRPDRAGVVYLPTGRSPSDLVVSSDQKRLYILQAIDKNIMIYDLENLTPLQDTNNKTLLLPQSCDDSNCLKTPVKMLLVARDAKQEELWVADASRNVIQVLDVLPNSKTFGKITKTITAQGVPGSFVLSEDKSFVIVTNLSGNKVTRIDTATHAATAIDIGTQTQVAELTLNGRFLYSIDLVNSGIHIFDLQNKKAVKQGNKRFPELSNIQLFSSKTVKLQAPDITFLALKRLQFHQRTSDSAIISRNGILATGTDGYAYFIDTENHRIFNQSTDKPSVLDTRLVLPDGIVRDPEALPSIKQDSLAMIENQTRSENWKLTYQGVILDGTSGSTQDATKGTFIDTFGFDFQATVLKGDQLLLGTECDINTGKNSNNEDCQFLIEKVEGNTLTLDVTNKKLPDVKNQAYQIRSFKTYIAQGSISGILKLRAKENELFKTNFFQISIASGKADTPTDASFEFTSVSGYDPERVRINGQAKVIISAREQPACDTSTCGDERCKSHPTCTKTNCDSSQNLCSNDEVCNFSTGKCVANKRIWILDPIRDRCQVLETLDALALERSIE